MSAFFLARHHIDLLVSAGVEQGVLFSQVPNGPLEAASEANALALGRMLWSENARSVVCRYNLSGTEEERLYQEDVSEYAFRFYPGLRASAINSAVACFDFQSCEWPGYHDGPAAAFVNALASVVGRTRYDGEPWGFDTEAQVVAAQGQAKCGGAS